MTIETKSIILEAELCHSIADVIALFSGFCESLEEERDALALSVTELLSQNRKLKTEMMHTKQKKKL